MSHDIYGHFLFQSSPEPGIFSLCLVDVISQLPNARFTTLSMHGNPTECQVNPIEDVVQLKRNIQELILSQIEVRFSYEVSSPENLEFGLLVELVSSRGLGPSERGGTLRFGSLCSFLPEPGHERKDLVQFLQHHLSDLIHQLKPGGVVLNMDLSVEDGIGLYGLFLSGGWLKQGLKISGGTYFDRERLLQHFGTCLDLNCRIMGDGVLLTAVSLEVTAIKRFQRYFAGEFFRFRS